MLIVTFSIIVLCIFTMPRMGFPTHLVSLILNLLTNQSATKRWNDEHSRPFPNSKGVMQRLHTIPSSI